MTASHASHSSQASIADSTIKQDELDELLLLNGFLTDEASSGRSKSLVDEIKDAVLDSGKLTLKEWRALRDRLKEIEQLIPHIDLIIELKAQRRTVKVQDETGTVVAKRKKAD